MSRHSENNNEDSFTSSRDLDEISKQLKGTDAFSISPPVLGMMTDFTEFTEDYGNEPLPLPSIPPTREQLSQSIANDMTGTRGALFDSIQIQTNAENPWLLRLREKLADKNLRRVFGKLDKSRRGYLTRGDIRAAMIKLKIPVPENEFLPFFKSIDNKNDDRISYQEFIVAMRRADQINKALVYLKATLSFCAVVLFWNGIYDGAGMLPLDMIKDFVVGGLDRTQGEGFWRLRAAELVVGATQEFWTAVVGTGVNEVEEEQRDRGDQDALVRDTYRFGAYVFHLDRLIRFNSLGIACVVLWVGLDNIFNSTRLILMQGLAMWGMTDPNMTRGGWNAFFWVFANIVLVWTRTMSNQFGGDYYSTAVMTFEEEE